MTAARTPRTRPSAAFMYDHFLGGDQAEPVDVQAADNLTALNPAIPQVARLNRDFLQRVVRYFAGRGHLQFLDIGSGLPTQDNVHQVAREMSPACRTVYVDFDPLVVERSQQLLEGDRHAGGRVAMVEADLRDVATLLDRVRQTGILDFSRPIVVLVVAVLHFVDGPPVEVGENILRALSQEVAQGSYLAVSHGSATEAAREKFAQVVADSKVNTGGAVYRTPEDLAQMLECGWDLLEPGLVPADRWRGIGPARTLEAWEQDDTGDIWFCVGVAQRQT